MDLSLRIETDLGGVSPAAWDALDHGSSPFLEHGFLRALEVSGSTGKGSGWLPHYLIVEDLSAGAAGGDSPRLLGAVAAFIKDHSYGEYIFDFPWARAAMRGGLPYYPKLVIAAPVTPATGKRILLSPQLDDETRGQVVTLLLAAVRELAEAADCSSVHWLFCTAQEHNLLAEAGFMPRASFQFHFQNPGFGDFDQFLGSLASRKRKQIRKERRRALEHTDGAVEFVPGGELADADLASLDRFYRRTCYMHGGQDYLQPGFFEALVERLPERVRFARVRSSGSTVAGALYLQTERALYGRYWGCSRHIDYLHFETAYYAGVEHCIRERLALFEAGAQGEHKLLRGFTPSPTYSNHWIRHGGLRSAVQRFLREEARSLPSYMKELTRYSPFRKNDDGSPCDIEIEAPAAGGEVGEEARPEGVSEEPAPG